MKSTRVHSPAAHLGDETISYGAKLPGRKIAPIRMLCKRISRQRTMFIVAVLGLAWFLLFSYFPMWGALISFKRYDFTLGILGSPWIGFDHFREFFQDADFLNILRNTIAISLLKLVFAFPAPIILAVLLNEVVHSGYKRFVQTVSSLPHFISWVVVSGLFYQLLSPSTGPIIPFLSRLGLTKPDLLILGEAKYFWAVAVVSDIWKEIGWIAVIYLAAITAIDPTLYEAATIDGAGRFRQMRSITLPSIASTIIVLLILTVANILQANFDQIWLLRNNSVVERAEIIDTYVFVQGIQLGRYDFAAAVGLFKSAINVMLLAGANTISRRMVGSSIY